MWDGAGTTLVLTDSGATCSIVSTGGIAGSALCPSVTIRPCGVGARHYIGVAGTVENSGAGNYRMVLTVRDADSNELPPSKIKLGGGAKPKLPAFQKPDGLYAAPIVNDGQWLNQ